MFPSGVFDAPNGKLPNHNNCTINPKYIAGIYASKKKPINELVIRGCEIDS